MSIYIYPNRYKDSKINFSDKSGNIEVNSLGGVNVYSGIIKDGTIDLSSLSKGVHIFQYNLHDKPYFGKIILD